MFTARQTSLGCQSATTGRRSTGATRLSCTREQSFVLLYRLLFILFAEDRKLLPYRVNRVYTDNRSLGRFRDEIAAKLDRVQRQRDVDFDPAQCDVWPGFNQPVRPD